MSLPRAVLPGTTYLITRRCTQRQLLLRPSRMLNQTFQYCLARSLKSTGIELHAFCVLSNHYHLVVTDVHGRLPEFVRWLNEFVAKCLNSMLGRWEQVWSSGTFSAVRLESSRTVFEKIVYTLTNPVAAGLVRHGYQWPGLRSPINGLCSFTVKRPHVFFRSDGPTPKGVTLTVTPPPYVEDHEAFGRELVRAVEEREAELRRSAVADGKTFLGRRAVRRQSRWAKASSDEVRRGLRPTVACHDKWKRIEALQRLKEFVNAYRVAWLRFRDGDTHVLFPAGTYAMRVHYGVPCAPA